MFNRTNIIVPQSSPSVVRHETTVHEHRAPTDESARMILEHEEAARKRIIDQFQTIDNPFVMTAVVYEMPADDSYMVRWKFLLNGEEMTGDYRVRDYDLQKPEARGDVLKTVYEIAVKEIVAQTFDQIAQPFAEAERAMR